MEDALERIGRSASDAAAARASSWRRHTPPRRVTQVGTPASSSPRGSRLVSIAELGPAWAASVRSSALEGGSAAPTRLDTGKGGRRQQRGRRSAPSTARYVTAQEAFFLSLRRPVGRRRRTASPAVAEERTFTSVGDVVARVARANTGRTRALVADQPARRAVVPVLFDEGATRRRKSAFRGTSRCGSSSSSWTGRVCSSCLNPRARRKPAQRAAASSRALALPSVLPDCTKRCATSAAALPPFVTAHRTNNDSQGLDALAGSSNNSVTSPSSTIARRIAVRQAEAHTSFPFLAVFCGAQPASSSPRPATNDAAPVAAGYLPSTPLASPQALDAQSSQIDAVSCFAAINAALNAPGGAPAKAFAAGSLTEPDVASGNC